jgi:hypothetical protein
VIYVALMGEVPNPRESSPAWRPSVGRPGWKPADDDHELEATAWRAEVALHEVQEARRENAETREAVKTLDGTIKHLDATIKASDADWNKRTKTLQRLVWLVVGAALTSFGGQVGLAVWRWFAEAR